MRGKNVGSGSRFPVREGLLALMLKGSTVASVPVHGDMHMSRNGRKGQYAGNAVENSFPRGKNGESCVRIVPDPIQESDLFLLSSWVCKILYGNWLKYYQDSLNVRFAEINHSMFYVHANVTWNTGGVFRMIGKRESMMVVESNLSAGNVEI